LLSGLKTGARSKPYDTKGGTEGQKMARPKKKTELKRTRKVTLMYTEDEYDEISGNAHDAGITLSTFIRSKSLLGYVRIPKYAKIDSTSIAELSKLGGFMKKYYTDTGGENKEKTAAILDDIAGIVMRLRMELDDREAHSKP
jgi:adenine/guanine phosphoribosyltransferase-like PRPP-binding protein